MRIWIQRIRNAALGALLGLSVAPLAMAQSSSGLTPPNPDEVVENYKMANMQLEGVLEVLSQLTGRAILRPQSLPKPEITFDSGGPITTSELVLALESLLSLNDIGISPLGERFLKVVPLNEISTEAPELVTQSLAARAPSGQVVSKLFRLQHLDSQTFQQQIQPFLSPGFHSIIPFKNSNAVIVTDTISNLQRLEYVVGEVDKPSRLNIEPVFYTLQYAEAGEVAQQIQQMIDDARNRFGDSNSSGNSGGGRNNANASTVNPVASNESDGSISQILFGSNTAISADDRTNQIIIMTAPSNLEFFEDIIRKLDIKADPSTRIDVIPLKHADATEVASLLSQFVSGKTKSDTSDRSNSSSRNNARNSRTGGNPTFGGSDSNQAVTRELPTNPIANATAGGGEERDSQFSSFMTILADERSNSLVISGTRSDLELMGVLVDKIDVLLPQVRIEVLITEVNLNKNDGITRGMDAFSVSYEEQDDGSGNITIPGLNFLGLGSSGTFNYDDGVISNLTMDLVLNKARSSNNVELLSQPTIVTTHNKEATIVVAEARPIVTSSQTSAISDSFRQSVQYQDIGIELTVTPLIGPNDVIQLEIDQKIDDVTDEVTIGGDRQPIIGRRQATSYVSVANGELIVLGGLQRSRAENSKSKMAFLGEIPLVGGLFSLKGKEKLKSELLVFIRPRVMRTTDDVNSDAKTKLNQLEARETIEHFLETGSFRDEVKEEEPGAPKPKGFRK